MTSTLKQSRESRQESFNNWMKEKIKSIYYSQDERMVEAFERVE